MSNIEEKLLNKTDTTMDTKSNSKLSAPYPALAPMPIFFPADLFIPQKSNNINRIIQPTIQHVVPHPISRSNQKKRYNLKKMNF